MERTLMFPFADSTVVVDQRVSCHRMAERRSGRDLFVVWMTPFLALLVIILLASSGAFAREGAPQEKQRDTGKTKRAATEKPADKEAEKQDSAKKESARTADSKAKGADAEQRKKSKKSETQTKQDPAGDTKESDEAADDGVQKIENPFPNRFKAPELDGGAEWLNCEGEISLKDLKGKVVLLDFWTYCCINCMHILPDLKFLEQKYPDELVVIGVHSAKFDNEKDTENIRRAIVRYEIEHPVINDNEMTVWRKFGVRSWPTLVLLDPEGQYCGYISGEGNREVLDSVIERLIAYHSKKGTLDKSPVNFSLEQNRHKSGALKFPGKVLADEKSKRLFISDSNHNRIVVAGLDGSLIATIGTGATGRDDGAFDKATFDHPQGMALEGSLLYVADTENHMIRLVDLESKSVTTLAGTGTQGHERFQGGDGLKVALNSPWDLHLQDGELFIAMAGPHQLWTYTIEKKTVQPYAGSGREDVTNGILKIAGMPGVDFDAGDFKRIAAFAQPSGLASDGKSLFVVDSEGSSIRKVPMDGKGTVTTLAGTSDLPGGQSLFAFGDKDGIGDEARFQHPLGIAWHDGTLYVADSYNHKIKTLDPKTGQVKTLFGTGRAGNETKPFQLSEPAGLAIAGDSLFIADTNNHQIRQVDLKTGTPSVFTVAGLEAPSPPKRSAPLPEVDAVDLPEIVVANNGDSVEVELAVTLPDDYKFNPNLVPTFRVKSTSSDSIVTDDVQTGKQEAGYSESGKAIVMKLPLRTGVAAGELLVTVTFGYCREGKGGLCKMKTLAWKLPLKISADADAKVVKLNAKVD